MQPIPLAVLPTPIEHLPRLSAHLGVDPYAKRDDLTGSALSGDKFGKLQFLLADVVERRARAVVGRFGRGAELGGPWLASG